MYIVVVTSYFGNLHTSSDMSLQQNVRLQTSQLKFSLWHLNIATYLTMPAYVHDREAAISFAELQIFIICTAHAYFYHFC